MGIFGWSLPPGCGTLPGEEPEPSESELMCKAQGKRILRHFGAESWGDVYRALYKGTSCGVTVGVLFSGADRPLYCDDLYKCDKSYWPLEVHVSSIVEGIDATTDTEIVSLSEPFVVRRLYEACTLVEKEAESLWNQTHGCETCQDHWIKEGFGDGEIDGAIPVWDECPDCQGHGQVI